MTLPIAWASTACVNDHYEPESESESYILRLNIHTEASTRSSNHDKFDATAAESYINVAGGDYSIILFDASGNYIAEVANPIVIPTSDDSYCVESQLTSELFKDMESFQVMVLANWKSYDATASYDHFAGNTTLSGIYSDNLKLNFNHQQYLPDNSTWTPDIEDKRCIPMFGLNSVQKSSFQTVEGKKTANITIPMLRALAKIEVIDAIQNKGGTASIENVSLSKFNTSGRFIPNVTENTSWNDNEIQVEKPSLPASVTTATGLKFFKETKTIENNTYPVYTAYVTEMDLGSTLNEERTHLDVSVKSSPTSEVTKDYRIEFWEYLNNSLNENSTNTDYNHILRNHIYSYKVERVNGYDLSLTLNVLGWDATEEELWYYEDIPGKVNPIQWSQYAFLDDTKSPSVTLHISEASNQILVGKFLIPQPLSGIWHAYLQTIGNAQPKAIEFCKEDGTSFDNEESKKHQQGNIKDFNPENLAKLYIKAAYTTPEHESSFRLVIMVENLGNWMEVDITPERTDNNYYTIIRQSNEI